MFIVAHGPRSELHISAAVPLRHRPPIQGCPVGQLWGPVLRNRIVVLRMEGCDVRSLRYGIVRPGPKFEIVCSCGVLLSASQQLLVNCVSDVPEQQAHFGLPCTVPRLWFRQKNVQKQHRACAWSLGDCVPWCAQQLVARMLAASTLRAETQCPCTLSPDARCQHGQRLEHLLSCARSSSCLPPFMSQHHALPRYLIRRRWEEQLRLAVYMRSQFWPLHGNKLLALLPGAWAQRETSRSNPWQTHHSMLPRWASCSWESSPVDFSVCVHASCIKA